jgi:hypothetical protein
MTASQSLKIYEILGKHFNNTEDAKIVVTEIEQIIETKILEKKDLLATKEDISQIRIDIEKRFNQLIIWIVGTFIALTGIFIAVMKL